MQSDRGNVKSLKVSYIAAWISLLLIFDTPPPTPQIKAKMKCTVKTLEASSYTPSFICFFKLCRMLQIFVAHWIKVEGNG